MIFFYVSDVAICLLDIFQSGKIPKIYVLNFMNNKFSHNVEVNTNINF